MMTAFSTIFSTDDGHLDDLLDQVLYIVVHTHKCGYQSLYLDDLGHFYKFLHESLDFINLRNLYGPLDYLFHDLLGSNNLLHD
jgi:hypothetical protein